MWHGLSSRATRVWLVEFFAFANLAFLSLDIYLAHSVNVFAHGAEWIPIPFGLAALLLLPALAAPRHTGWPRTLGYVVAWAAIALGVAGLLFHLRGAFFEEQTIKSLVYAAPFIAPLSYVGVGMLLLVNRMEGNRATWGPWILLLAAGGFFGNFVLSLLDHAQNGFFVEVEWIGVAAGAFGFAFLIAAVEWQYDRGVLAWCGIVMGLEALVGVMGMGFHIAANMRVPGETWYDQIVFGAPVFAPLLFCNLALLAGIGLWDAAAVSADERRSVELSEKSPPQQAPAPGLPI